LLLLAKPTYQQNSVQFLRTYTRHHAMFQCAAVVRAAAGTRRYVKSESHKKARTDFEQALAHNAEITRCLSEFFAERGASGGVLERSMEFRAATMEVFMQNGVPLNKIEGFWKYLEYWGNSKLDDVSNMSRTFIPIIEKKYMNEIRDAVEKGYKMSVIWDGTNRTSEWYAVVIRWVTDTLKIEQRVVKMEPYIGKLKGNQLAQAINKSSACAMRHRLWTANTKWFHCRQSHQHESRQRSNKSVCV
jgi:hypothetical protein